MIKTYSLTTTKIIKRLLKDYGKDHVYSFVWANILMVLVAISTALYPIVIDYAFKSLEESDWEKICLIPILIIILTFVKGGALYSQTVIINSLVQSIILKIQSKLYESFINLDLDVINTEQTGALQSRIMNDVNLMKEAMIRSSNNLIRSVVPVIQ